jgi:hypothetical protein
MIKKRKLLLAPAFVSCATAILLGYAQGRGLTDMPQPQFGGNSKVCFLLLQRNLDQLFVPMLGSQLPALLVPLFEVTAVGKLGFHNFRALFLDFDLRVHIPVDYDDEVIPCGDSS